MMHVESEGKPVWSEKCNAVEKLNADYNRKLSEHTVHHNLLCMGLHSHMQVRVFTMTLFYHWKHLKWAHESQNCTNWSNGKKLPGLINQVFFLFFVFFSGGMLGACAIFTWGREGSRMHYEKSFQTKTMCHIFCIIYQTDHTLLMDSLWVCCLGLRLLNSVIFHYYCL